MNLYFCLNELMSDWIFVELLRNSESKITEKLEMLHNMI